MARSLRNSKVEDFEPKKKNPIGLLDDTNLDSHLKSLKIGDRNTPLQISSEELKIASDLSVDGNLISRMISTETDFTLKSSGDINLEAHGLDINFIAGTEKYLTWNYAGIMSFNNVVNTSEGFTIDASAGNGIAVLSTASDSAAGDLRLEPDGDLLIIPDVLGEVRLDKNTTRTTTGTERGIKLDYDATGIVASGQTVTGIGLDLDMNCESVTHVGTVNQTGIDIDMVAATDGTQTNTGINISCTGADTNTHLQLSHDSTNYCTVKTIANGATTIATVDSDGAAGHLKLDADGDIILDAVGGSGTGILLKDEGTLFGYFDIHHSASHLKLFENGGASTDDSFNIGVYANGETTLTTIDGGGAAAHINIEADGHVEFDNCGVGFDLVTPTFNASDTDVDFKLGNKQMVTLTDNLGDLNLTFPNTSGNFVLLLKQDGTGSRLIHPAGYLAFEHDGTAASGSSTVKFAGGSNPTLSTGANHVDILSFFWDADNQICYGVATLDFQF